MLRCGYLLTVCLILSSFLLFGSLNARGGEQSPWLGLSTGMLALEGDEAVESSSMVRLSLGYEFTEAWSLESSLMIVPTLDVRYRNSYGEKIPRAEFDETSAFGLSLDGLYHFHRAERFDPFLALGLGFLQFEEAPGSDEFNPSVRVGAGIQYHFSDAWAIRVEGRAFVAGTDTEINGTFDVGIVWRREPYSYDRALTGDLDSDGDGVTDKEETRRGTDPYNAKE
jgi:opacity protein-like surface antigen